jgi:hypothetical protein
VLSNNSKRKRRYLTIPLEKLKIMRERQRQRQRDRETERQRDRERSVERKSTPYKWSHFSCCSPAFLTTIQIINISAANNG